MGTLKPEQFSDEQLMAYADGQLDEVTCRSIEQQLPEDEALCERLAVFQQSSDLLKVYDTVLNDPIPEQVMGTIDKITPMPSSHWWSSLQKQPMAIAASIALCIGLGIGLLTDNLINNQTTGGVLHAALPDTLNRQPTGVPLVAQSDNAVYEITPLGTFKNSDSEYCRSFELTHVPSYTRIGFACRAADSDWDVHMLLPPGALAELQPDVENTYRPASSGKDIIEAAKQQLGFNELVAEEEEQRLIDNDWLLSPP